MPAGNLYIKDQMPLVPNNALVADIQEIGKIPVRLGQNLYIRDVADIQDGTDVNYGYALVDGKKSVYLPIIKKDTASTLTVVADVYKSLQVFKDAVPGRRDSPFRVRRVADRQGGDQERRDRRLHRRRAHRLDDPDLPARPAQRGRGGAEHSAGVDWLAGRTVDDRQHDQHHVAGRHGACRSACSSTKRRSRSRTFTCRWARRSRLARAVERGSMQTAVPRLLAMLCILSVFIPAFVMQDPMRALFMPLALAVGFAMISSYLLSSTLVPVVCVWILKHREHHEGEEEGILRPRAGSASKRWSAPRSPTAIGWLPAIWRCAGWCCVIGGSQFGTELFPQIDSGEFVLRYRPPPGSNFEITRQLGVKILQIMQEEAGPGNIEICLGYAGQIAPNFGMNNIVLFMRGPDDGWLRAKFREDSGVKLDAFRERMRKILPERIAPFVAKAAARVRRRAGSWPNHAPSSARSASSRATSSAR